MVAPTQDEAELFRSTASLRLVKFVMSEHPRSPPATDPKVFRFLISAFGVLLTATAPAKALDLDELTVVTLAQDGSWGVATAGSQGLAIAAAVRDCRAMAAAPSDCGAQFTTTREGWVVASLCGDHKIMVAAETREDAERAAIKREIDFRLLHVPAVPPCRRVLTVNPSGAILPGQAAPTHQIDARRGQR